MTIWYYWNICANYGKRSRAHLFRSMTNEGTPYGVTLCGRGVYPEIGTHGFHEHSAPTRIARCATCERLATLNEKKD